MFLVVVFIVMLILHGYVGIRFIAPFTLGAGPLALYWIAILVLALMPLSVMIIRFRGVENGLIDNLLMIGYTSLGLFSLAFVIFLFRDLGWLLVTLFQKVPALAGGSVDTLPGPGVERRQFLLLAMNWGIVGLTFVLGMIGLFQARFKPLIQHVQLPMEKYSTNLGRLKIAQITDLHVGPTIKVDFVQAVVDQVNALEPDMIFFTGDMVDGSVDHLENDVEPLRLLKARYGIYFVTGNHEYYSGAEQWVEKARELGMTPLMNEHITINFGTDKLVIAGVTDLMAHQMEANHKSDPIKALKDAPRDVPTILLAHQPGTADQVQDLDIDLMVCGHTHGGQFIPFNWAVAEAHKYISGLYEQGKMFVYVNRGTGYWGPPLRLGIPSEITLFTFVEKTA